MTGPAAQPGLGVALAPELVARLESEVPAVARLTLTAVTTEVPEYAGSIDTDTGRVIRSAIAAALGTFLRLLSAEQDAEAPLAAARRGAYQLGRGEARAGRSVDALLAAYRIGARASWREMAATAVDEDTAAGTIARFAETVFAYIDELSAASLAGHTDEVAASGRLRRERREQLARALVAGAGTEVLLPLAEKATWSPPRTLTAVLVPAGLTHDVLPRLPAHTLAVIADTPDGSNGEDTNVLLVPDADRHQVLVAVEGRATVVGPARPWTRVHESVVVGERARALGLAQDDTALDTGAHLPLLVVSADPGTHDDLHASVLAPFERLPVATAARLTDTLRAWLLHLGRRSEVAQALHIHPQTVRYRMNQVKEQFGDRLDDPDLVEALVVALAAPRRQDAAEGDHSP